MILIVADKIIVLPYIKAAHLYVYQKLIISVAMDDLPRTVQ